MQRRFQLILIKPSHYDDDGYVVQWARAFLPSNSLAVLYGIALASAQRAALGPNVAIDVNAIDEVNTRVKPAQILAQLRRHGDFGLVALVGVQSNQFPRAVDIARPLRAAGMPVMIGGFHVSGCIAMLPALPADLKSALDMGISLFAGELEGRMDDILRDAATRALKPIYNYMDSLPSLESEPTPILPPAMIRRTVQHMACFDAGRGCPYQCSFCTIINVQGRKSRHRSADDVEHLIRAHWAQGIRHFFITDDNFARNRNWEAIFDRLAELRHRDKLNLKLVIQVDTLCHKIPNFVAKAQRAGVTRAFIGLENINPSNLKGAKKNQNKITEYRKMLLDWKQAGVITYAGYILGFPADTPESILADIEIIKRELPVDILEFFVLTPLPGSEDHKVLFHAGAWMDPDMNKYDSEHVVTGHAKMSKQEWEDIYKLAWHAYYTREHIETILRRGVATRASISRLWSYLFVFGNFVTREKVHPLQGGFLRRKYRLDRRPGLPIEPIWNFYFNYARDFVVKYVNLLGIGVRLFALSRRLARNPDRYRYMDQALTPVSDGETESLELFTHNDDARHAVEHQRKITQLTGAKRQLPGLAVG